jgi:N-glycosylase/DNA lyase
MKDVLRFYNENKQRIQTFLDLSKQKQNSKEDVFFELCFCILTPQSRAPLCRKSLDNIWSEGLKGKSKKQILGYLDCVRFNDRKADYLILAQNNFDNIYTKIGELKDNSFELREWLVKNIKGYGYKEATHFLRNIGLGENFAMFDVHILRFMKGQDIVDEDSVSSRKKYLEYEQKFIELAKRNGLKPAELDISIWLKGSGNDEIM